MKGGQRKLQIRMEVIPMTLNIAILLLLAYTSFIVIIVVAAIILVWDSQAIQSRLANRRRIKLLKMIKNKSPKIYVGAGNSKYI